MLAPVATFRAATGRVGSTWRAAAPIALVAAVVSLGLDALVRAALDPVGGDLGAVLRAGVATFVTTTVLAFAVAVLALVVGRSDPRPDAAPEEPAPVNGWAVVRPLVAERRAGILATALWLAALATAATVVTGVAVDLVGGTAGAIVSTVVELVALVLTVRWSVALVVAARGDAAGRRALRRSSQHARGSGLRILGLLVLLLVALVAVSLLAVALLDILGPLLPIGVLYVLTLLLITTAMLPLTAAVLVELRHRTAHQFEP